MEKPILYRGRRTNFWWNEYYEVVCGGSLVLVISKNKRNPIHYVSQIIN